MNIHAKKCQIAKNEMKKSGVDIRAEQVSILSLGVYNGGLNNKVLIKVFKLLYKMKWGNVLGKAKQTLKVGEVSPSCFVLIN